jgi:hypothetical protein
MLMPSYNLAAKFLMLQIVDRISVPVPCFEAIAANSFFQGRDRSFHAIYSLPTARARERTPQSECIIRNLSLHHFLDVCCDFLRFSL